MMIESLTVVAQPLKLQRITALSKYLSSSRWNTESSGDAAANHFAQIFFENRPADILSPKCNVQR